MIVLWSRGWCVSPSLGLYREDEAELMRKKPTVNTFSNFHFFCIQQTKRYAYGCKEINLHS